MRSLSFDIENGNTENPATLHVRITDTTDFVTVILELEDDYDSISWVRVYGDMKKRGFMSDNYSDPETLYNTVDEGIRDLILWDYKNDEEKGGVKNPWENEEYKWLYNFTEETFFDTYTDEGWDYDCKPTFVITPETWRLFTRPCTALLQTLKK